MNPLLKGKLFGKLFEPAALVSAAHQEEVGIYLLVDVAHSADEDVNLFILGEAPDKEDARPHWKGIALDDILLTLPFGVIASCVDPVGDDARRRLEPFLEKEMPMCPSGKNDMIALVQEVNGKCPSQGQNPVL